jgi:phosphotriesterase-related protein
MNESVTTVLGPVPAEELGHTQTHEHLLIDVPRVKYRWDFEGLLESVAVAIDEVRTFRAAGGTTLVEVTTIDLGRDPAGLAEIARATGVNIVMGTGFYREPYYPEFVDRSSTRWLAELLIEERLHPAGGDRRDRER